MTGTEIAGIITASAALVGTIGGLVVSYRTLQRTFWQDKPRVKVYGKMAHITGQKGTQFSIKIANVGTKEYTVAMIAVMVGRHSGHLVIPSPTGTVSLPYKLQPGETCDFWTPKIQLDKEIRKMTTRKHIDLRAEVHDYIGVSFVSSPHRYVLKEARFKKLRDAIRGHKSALMKLLWP